MRILCLLLILLISFASYAQKPKQEEVCYDPNSVKDTTKKSIKSMAIGLIGKDTVKIAYHSPGVRKRIIWGGLVPFDEVWVTGAHDATNIIINKPFSVAGKMIPPGKYALFTIPGTTEWTFIINKNWEQHLASAYDEKDDVIRLKVIPQVIPHVERLQYFVTPTEGNKGTISIAWEKVRLEVPITIHER